MRKIFLIRELIFSPFFDYSYYQLDGILPSSHEAFNPEEFLNPVNLDLLNPEEYPNLVNMDLRNPEDYPNPVNLDLRNPEDYPNPVNMDLPKNGLNSVSAPVPCSSQHSVSHQGLTCRVGLNL